MKNKIKLFDLRGGYEINELSRLVNNKYLKNILITAKPLILRTYEK